MSILEYCALVTLNILCLMSGLKIGIQIGIEKGRRSMQKSGDRFSKQ